jgi:hypothetical protein
VHERPRAGSAAGHGHHQADECVKHDLHSAHDIHI